MPTFLKFFTLAIVFVFLNGCQATSKYAGTEPVTISAKLADGLERYFGDHRSTAIAISNGTSFGFTWCEHSRCQYPTGSAETYAIKLCERNNSNCKVFAIQHSIVWEGPISVANDKQTSNIVRIKKFTGAGNFTSYAGTTNISKNAISGPINIKLSGQNCDGDFDASEQKWLLKCNNGSKISGTIAPSDSSLFWGRSHDGLYEISIARKGWPILEAKIKSHRASYNVSD